MKLSLSTNWCNRRLESGEEIAEKALALGFDELELGFHTSVSQVEGFRRLAGRIPVGSIHAFCPVPISAPQGYPELYQLASFDREERALARVHVTKNIEFASSIGADTVVLHAGRVAFSTLFRTLDSPRLREVRRTAKGGVESPAYRKLLARSLASRRRQGERMLSGPGGFLMTLESLVPVLEHHRVTLALENLPYLEGFPNEAEMTRILEALGGAPIRAWFDTGHNRVRESFGWVAAGHRLFDDEFVRDLSGGAFAGLHLNDVVDFDDDHLPPGEGRVDFAALAPLAARARHVVFEPNREVGEKALAAGIAHIRRLWSANFGSGSHK